MEKECKCGRCGATNVVGPFTMDGNVSGEYRTDAVWIVCRECNGSTFLGFEGMRVA